MILLYITLIIPTNLQPSHAVATPTCAGAAAQASEMEKDDCHDKKVIAIGGKFSL